jgi:hypothetical protein
MKRLLSPILTLALAFSTLLTPAAPYLLAGGVVGVAVTQTACDEKDVHKVKVKVDQSATILNTAAKSNRELYRSGVYGAAGSLEAIATRQKVAKGIHEANEYLSEAVEVAARLQPGMNGREVFDLLTKAVQELVHVRVGKDQIDVLIQSAVTAINSAILLAQAIKE